MGAQRGAHCRAVRLAASRQQLLYARLRGPRHCVARGFCAVVLPPARSWHACMYAMRWRRVHAVQTSCRAVAQADVISVAHDQPAWLRMQHLIRCIRQPQSSAASISSGALCSSQHVQGTKAACAVGGSGLHVYCIAACKAQWQEWSRATLSVSYGAEGVDVHFGVECRQKNFGGNCFTTSASQQEM